MRVMRRIMTVPRDGAPNIGLDGHANGGIVSVLVHGGRWRNQIGLRPGILRREGRAAAAGVGGVGVLEDEAAAHEFVLEVDFGAIQVEVGTAVG